MQNDREPEKKATDEGLVVQDADAAIAMLNAARVAGEFIGDDVDFIVREMQSLNLARSQQR